MVTRRPGRVRIAPQLTLWMISAIFSLYQAIGRPYIAAFIERADWTYIAASLSDHKALDAFRATQHRHRETIPIPSEIT